MANNRFAGGAADFDNKAMDQSFYDQIELGLNADITGWDFAWLDGHATEERPPWGYANLLGERMATAHASLDIQTGGGEILAGVPAVPPVAAAAIYLLRKVIWWVPGFTVDKYRDRLWDLHRQVIAGIAVLGHD